MRTQTLLACLATAIVAVGQTKNYEQEIPGTDVKFRMVAIPAGTITIGSPASDKSRDADEGPQRKVQISAFWIEEHEVTFAEWDAFFKNGEIAQTKAIAVDAVSRPTAQYIDLTWGMGRDASQPTNSMSHQAAMMYCKWLTEKTGIFYRLPTEAEWEYACKAGTSQTIPLNTTGYSRHNSQEKFHRVKELKPNALGLYDMLGNLSEWTLDQYDPAAFEKWHDGVKDPVVLPASKYPKVVKGGSYMDESKELRCSNRIASEPAWNKRDPQIPKSRWWLTDGMFVGFRVVRPAVVPSKEEIDKFFISYLK